MASPLISSRKEKEIKVSFLSINALLEALKNVKAKHRPKIIKELKKRNYDVSLIT